MVGPVVVAEAHTRAGHVGVAQQQVFDLRALVAVGPARWRTPHRGLPLGHRHGVGADGERGQEAVQRLQVETLERHGALLQQVGQAFDGGIVEVGGGSHGGITRGGPAW